MGGLATGLSSLDSDDEILWIGWPGLPADDLSEQEKAEISHALSDRYRSLPVALSSEELKSFYYGFCNNVIWPLFHYFPSYARYDNSLWESYKRVNLLYLDKVLEVAQAGDTIWVHDYQLMLLPSMIRRHLKEIQIGFFLHIPFPSFEVFRLLPWRAEILRGLLGSDLIGFHSYDYARHFISSVRRLLGLENNMGYLQFEDRLSRVDVFPMGIDYGRYANALANNSVVREMERAAAQFKGFRIILSVDRLDYTKGIPQRLRAYEQLLESNPQYREKVVLLLIAVPSRTKVQLYRALKREIEELISDINGKYGTIGWVPIHYFYRGFPFEKLSAMYGLAEVLLVTPLRDGMNLVAKEYVAVHKDRTGVLILSETTGSAREMSEALLINPNNSEEITAALKTALEMEEKEQIERNAVLNERLSRYDVSTWTEDFLDKLRRVEEVQRGYLVKKVSDALRAEIAGAYKKAETRLIVLDYDGTLVPFADRPRKAFPDARLIELLSRLAKDPKNEIVVASGRSRSTMSSWLGDLKISLIAEHGIWLKRKAERWRLIEPLSNEWKDQLRPIFELFKDRTPGSIIEEKEYSLAWDVRKAEHELAGMRASELKDILFSMTGDLNLDVLEINTVLEVKQANINKSQAVGQWLADKKWQFVLAAGDDSTDEEVFTQLSASSYSIKVGMGISEARFYVESPGHLRRLLRELL